MRLRQVPHVRRRPAVGSDRVRRGAIDFRTLPFERLTFCKGGRLNLVVGLCQLFSLVVQCDPFGLEEITLRGKRPGLRGKSRLLRSEGFAIRLQPGSFGFNLLRAVHRFSWRRARFSWRRVWAVRF